MGGKNCVYAKYGHGGKRIFRIKCTDFPTQFGNLAQGIFDFLTPATPVHGKQVDCSDALFTEVVFFKGEAGPEVARTTVTLGALRRNETTALRGAFDQAISALVSA